MRIYDGSRIDTPLLATLAAHSDEVRSVSFSPVCETLASASRDGTVKLWDLREMREVDTLKGYSFGGHSCAFSPDGEILASGGVDYHVLLWDGPSMNCGGAVTIRAASPQVDQSYDTVFSTDGQTAAVTSGDSRSSVRIIQTRDWQEQAVLEVPAAVRSMAISKDSRLAIGGDSTVSLFDLRTASGIASQTVGGNRTVRTLAFNDHDGSLIAGLDNGAILLWGPEAVRHGKPFQFTGHQSAVTCLAVARDGELLASGSADHRVMLWNLRTRALVNTLTAHRDTVTCLAFSPTDSLLASGALEHAKALCLWDLSKPKSDPQVIMSARTVYSLVFSPDGSVLCAAHGDNTVRLWDVRSGQQRLRLRGHDSAVQSLALSVDGRTLLSGDRYGTVRVWHAASPEQLATAPPWWADF